MQGSDHAPVWADWNLAGPLPTPEAAPPLSTRYMFTGTHMQNKHAPDMTDVQTLGELQMRLALKVLTFLNLDI